MRLAVEKIPLCPSDNITNNRCENREISFPILTFNHLRANVNIRKSNILFSKLGQVTKSLLYTNHIDTYYLAKELAIVAYDMFSSKTKSEHIKHCPVGKSLKEELNHE